LSYPVHARTMLISNFKTISHFSYLEKYESRSSLLILNHLTPNGHYMGHTAQLTSRCCILYIYSTNTRIEYFKHAEYSPFLPLQNAVYFIMLLFLVPVLFTF